jgi:hypothetical protein
VRRVVTHEKPAATAAGVSVAKATWFEVAEAHHVVPHDGSKQFVATVKPGENAPPGTQWLTGWVYCADAAPEEDSVNSSVTFEIKAPPEKSTSKGLLWASIGAALVVVPGVVLFSRASKLRIGDGGRSTTHGQATARCGPTHPKCRAATRIEQK